MRVERWIGQRARTADRRREVALDLRAGLRGLAVREAVENGFEALRRQVLIGVVPDQHHRGVHAGAEALDLFPRIIAIGRNMERLGMNFPRADLEQRARAARPAWRRGGHLYMGSSGD